MKRRTMIGLLAVLTGGLVAGAGALAFGAHAHRHGMMKRFVSAAIDDALDEAKVTPEQRAAIHDARDRVFTALQEHAQTRRARLDELLQLFEADQVDGARVAALRRGAEDEHRKIADAIGQALTDAHDTLTPAQRKAVADYVRSHRPHAMR
jgi:Spy/CpxP family protein refolding chaperone